MLDAQPVAVHHANKQLLGAADNRHTNSLSTLVLICSPHMLQDIFPVHRRYVYDGVLEAQFVMVHDANKQLLGVADIYPAGFDVKKGDLTLRAFLRHDDPVLLEKLRHQPLVRGSAEY